MTEQTLPNALQREKDLYRYTTALERGDFDTLASILRLAESDPELERDIQEINAALSETMPAQAGVSPAANPPALARWAARGWNFLRGLFFSPQGRLRPWRTAAAGLVLLLFIGLLTSQTTSQTFGYRPVRGLLNNKSMSQSSVPLHDAPLPAAEPTRAPAATMAAAMDAKPGAPSKGSAAGPSVTVNEPRMIVRNGTINLVVKDTRQARDAIEKMTADMAGAGAFVVSTNEYAYGGTDMPAMNIVLRVPVDRFEEMMNSIAALAVRVGDRNETAQDVTQEYVDVSARIEQLQVSRERLLEIVQNAKNTDDLLKAEQELTQREAELEALKARQMYLQTTAALSQINVSLQPSVLSQPVAQNIWDPGETAHRAVTALLASLRDFVDGVIVFAITVLPWLVVIGLILYGFIRLVTRRRNRTAKA